MIKQVPASEKNYQKGRSGYGIQAIVIHSMAGTLIGTDTFFQQPRPDKPTSAHYAIGKNGETHQYVQDRDAAYHAGIVSNPTWDLLAKGVNPNWISVGIENEGYPNQGWTEPQMVALTRLMKSICATYNIAMDRDHIISHNEITDYKENMVSWCEEAVRRLNPQAELSRLQAILVTLQKKLAYFLGKNNS